MSTYYADYDDDPPTVELPAIDLHNYALSDAPRKVCDRCSAASRTHDEFCPQCAIRFSRRRPGQRRLITLLVSVLIIAGLIAAGAMMVAYNNAMTASAAAQSLQIPADVANLEGRQTPGLAGSQLTTN
ncbi:hypothetical protein [Arthrobacter pigmenti]